jgi:hypothetical protein
MNFYFSRKKRKERERIFTFKNKIDVAAGRIALPCFPFVL